MKTKSAVHGARAAAGQGEAAKTAANSARPKRPKRRIGHCANVVRKFPPTNSKERRMDRDHYFDTSDACPCEQCGCTGNVSCGATPVDIDMYCTLNSVLICRCCDELGAQRNKERWKPILQQAAARNAAVDR